MAKTANGLSKLHNVLIKQGAERRKLLRYSRKALTDLDKSVPLSKKARIIVSFIEGYRGMRDILVHPTCHLTKKKEVDLTIDRIRKFRKTLNRL